MKIVKIMGGLGNQMFQYTLYKRFLEKNVEVYGDLEFFNQTKSHNGYELKKIFNIEIPEMENKWKKFLYGKGIIKKIRKLYIKLNKKFLCKQEDVKYLNDIDEYTYYDGYWQSEKFFKEIEKEIRRNFNFPKFMDNKNIKISKLILSTNSVSLHIRRGDYKGNPFLDGLAPLSYYKNAIKLMEDKIKNPVYFIFSDDINWCRENFNFLKDVYYVDWNKREESFRDMQLMSLCKHNIIPNSSFSWWGAWLNNNSNKIVIAPEKWFRDESNFEYKDIVPEEWIKIKNY